MRTINDTLLKEKAAPTQWYSGLN